jgi:hypothetical protein
LGFRYYITFEAGVEEKDGEMPVEYRDSSGDIFGEKAYD